MPAPTGNKNAAKAKVWTAAINRALEKRSAVDRKEAIDALAEKLLEQCDQGNLQALQELGNRLEGKPAQTIQGGDTPIGLAISTIERTIVEANNTDS